MAVISELVESGLQLKRQGKLRGAIEHFRQLHATYPDSARIQFELANCWLAFGVPENALPHLRELLALPTAKSLPPKDMPRLHTQLATALHQLDERDEALEIIEAGLRAHPGYRPLRAWRIIALDAVGAQRLAVLDALELMLESLAPSRWDVYEDDIKQQVRQMRARLEGMESTQPPVKSTPAHTEDSPPPAAAKQVDSSQRISVSSVAARDDGFEVAVNVRKPAAKPKRRRNIVAQLGKKSVRINISGQDENDEESPAADAFKIPIDD